MAPDEDTESCTEDCGQNSICELSNATEKYGCSCLAGFNRTETKEPLKSYTVVGLNSVIKKVCTEFSFFSNQGWLSRLEIPGSEIKGVKFDYFLLRYFGQILQAG